MIIISIYVLFAAGAPVWLILQPRDFINVQILYGGIVLMVASILSVGLQGLHVATPAFNLGEGVTNLGLIWPMMFITIACGAISGFHSLVAGGTTGKQLANETDARKVGFNAMLLESALAVCVLIALGVGPVVRGLQVHRLAGGRRGPSPTPSWGSRWRPGGSSTWGWASRWPSARSSASCWWRASWSPPWTPPSG